jgi:pyruvate dehydrogenase E2 component (dihydrolipoamide acetyltransferase)
VLKKAIEATSPIRADVLPFRTASKIIPAGPSVRRLARELGVELEQIKGSGSQGRISKEDVKEFARQHLQQPQPAATVTAIAPAPQRPADSTAVLPDFSEFGPGHREALSGIQQATRNNMNRAWREIPHAWLQHQADISELERQRQRYKTMAKADGVALSLTPFMVKALALAMKEFPLFNASLDDAGNAIVYRDYIDIGVAVDTPRGLLVASVRQADNKTIYQLARDIDTLAGRARDGKLTVKDMQGAGITLSNLGNMGVSSIYPIINWPQVAIVGVAAGQWQQCRRDNGEWHEQLMLPLTLAFDHRIINGADAGRFLGFIKTLLENPFRICLY